MKTKSTTTKTKLQPKPEMKVDTTEPTIAVSEDVVETAPTPTATPPNVVSQELQRLAQRVKTLETQTSAGVDVSKVASLEAKVKSLETQVNSFRSEMNKIATLETKVKELSNTPKSSGESDSRVDTIVEILKRALPGYSKSL
jgi:polyhydroxyalkanoate synthesis regulator phasin